MGIFARMRAGAPIDSGTDTAMPDALRRALPPRFEAVAEALAPGSIASSGRLLAAATHAGRELASDGAPLEEALADLGRTYDVVAGRAPDFAVATALSVAWSEGTLAYLHQLSCEDPMTGLASLAHVRSRLSEHYRRVAPGQVSDRLGLVVIDMPRQRAGETPEQAAERSDTFARSLRLARLGEVARGVFGSSETIGRVGLHRLVVVVERNDGLGQRVGLLRRMIANTDVDGLAVRVWIEGLPGTDTAAASLLDELARS